MPFVSLPGWGMYTNFWCKANGGGFFFLWICWLTNGNLITHNKKDSIKSAPWKRFGKQFALINLENYAYFWKNSSSPITFHYQHKLHTRMLFFAPNLVTCFFFFLSEITHRSSPALLSKGWSIRHFSLAFGTWNRLFFFLPWAMQ